MIADKLMVKFLFELLKFSADIYYRRFSLHKASIYTVVVQPITRKELQSRRKPAPEVNNPNLK